MKKLVSILLLCFMLLSTLVACGGDEQTSGGGGGSSSDGSTYLPNVDFEGYSFRVLRIDGSSPINSLEDEDADETSVIYQASVERDSEIIDRFNIKIDSVYSGADNGITNFVIKDSLNPTSSYD